MNTRRVCYKYKWPTGHGKFGYINIYYFLCPNSVAILAPGMKIKEVKKVNAQKTRRIEIRL
jgi:hypothetical protein